MPDLKRRFPRYVGVHSQVFDGGGYPRFKSKERYRSFTYLQNTAFRILEDGEKMTLSGIGNAKLRYHRPLEGVPKTATITRCLSSKWYVSICRDLLDTPPQDGPLTGLDLGFSSDRAVTEPRRALQKSEKKLEREQTLSQA